MKKDDLRSSFNLEWKELDLDLEASKIAINKPDYTEEDKKLLKQYRDVVVAGGEAVAALYREEIKGGRTPEEALTQLAQVVGSEDNPQIPSAPKAKERYSGKVPVALFDLLQAGEKLTGKPIGLSRGLEFLQVSGLSEQPQYGQEEADRFLETCDLIINQGKSLAQVSQSNGVDSEKNFSAWVGNQAAQKIRAFSQNLAQNSTVLEEDLADIYQQQFLARMQQVFVSGEFDQACDRAREELRAQRRGGWPDIKGQYRQWLASQEAGADNTIEASVEPMQLPEGQD